MPQTWTPTDIISLIKFINHIWRHVEKTTSNLSDENDTHPLELLEAKLQHLSEALEYLRRETEHEKSTLCKNPERKREVGGILGRLSVDLNVLDIMVSRMKGGLGGDEEGFEGIGERLEERLGEMNKVLDEVHRAEDGGLNWALRGIANGWHHVHWADLVEVRYSKDEFYHMEHGHEVLKLDLRSDEENDEFITIFVRFQDDGFGTKMKACNFEVVAPRRTTLGDLKKVIREEIGVPICQQLLSHRGSMLDNDFTLEDCGLENESTLNGVIISKHVADGSRRTSWLWANGS